MYVTCHTNLDLSHEEWPKELPAVPSVGDIIVSGTKHRSLDFSDFRLELQVVKVSWEPSPSGTYGLAVEWRPVIELHMTNWQKQLLTKEGAGKGSIRAFYEWYAPKVGRDVSAFI